MSSENIENYVGWDCSGSVGGSKFYHHKTQEIVSKYDEKNTYFYRWDSDCMKISKNTLKYINETKQGFGGTNPLELIKVIKENNFKGNLIFITDGQISESTVKACMNALPDNWQFNMVYIYLIHTGGAINESVSCVFTQNSPHKIELYKFDINKNSYINESNVNVNKEDFELVNNISSINSIVEFINKVEILDNVLVSINMGKDSNPILHKELVALKNKLIKSQNNIEKDNIYLKDLINSFENGIQTTEKLSEVWNLYYKLNDNSWIKIIDKYISWASGALKTVFDRKNITNREINAKSSEIVETEKAEIITVDEEKECVLKIQCPISLEDSSNLVILMKKNDSNVFGDLPTNIRDSLINCPLNALRNNDIINYVKSLFDSVISLETYKELVEHGISDKSPLTREEIFGGLCLGKHSSHVKSTNSTIRYVLTGGKSLGNIDLWFAVIYLIIERGFVPHLYDFLPIIREHLIYRLLNSKSFMCLSGLPTYPTYNVPLGLALWSSITATSCDSELLKNPKNDPIRLHLSYANDIIDLLSLIDIKIPEDLIRHIKRIKVLRNFLFEIKKGSENKFKIQNLINALYYKSVETENMWVSIDGEIDDEQIEKVKKQLPDLCKNLCIQEIRYIYELCDSNKVESDIYIPYNLQLSPYIKSKIRNWKYDMNVPYSYVKISEKTCRPFFNIYEKGCQVAWFEKAHKIYGYEFMSVNNFFGNYVSENNKYPTKNEFLEYLYLYYSKRDKATLPMCIMQFVNEVFDEYKEIMEKIEPEEFANRWNKSVYIDVRTRMEY